MMSLLRIRNFLIKRLGGYGLIRVGATMAVAQGITILAGVGTTVLLARGLGTEGYGLYLFALNIAYVLAMPILAGLPTLVTRQVAIYRAQDDALRLTGIVRWAFRTVGFTSFVLMIAAGFFVIVPIRDGGLNFSYLLVFPLVIALALMRIASAIIQGFEQPFYGTLADGVIRPLCLIGFVALAGIFGALVPALALGLHLSAILVGLIWTFWYLRQRIGHTPNRDTAIRFESSAWLASVLPLSLIAAAGLINSRLDILMLGLLSENSQVAIYGLAMQMAGFILIGQTILNTIIGPQIARSYAEGDKARLQSLARYSAKIAFFSAIFIILVIFFFGEPVILYLVGEDFLDSVQIALIIGAGYVLNTSIGPVELTMNMVGREKLAAKLIWISALVNGILNVFLIPTFGAFGAAGATLVTTMIHQVLLLHRLNTLEGIRTAVFQRVRTAEVKSRVH